MGACGYPMLSTAFAGIELLGALTYPNSFAPHQGAAHFAHFWENYLYPSAGRKDVGAPLYQLVRHGVAHVFVAKGPINVHKKNPTWHLVRDSDGSVHIDAWELKVDLQRTYTGVICGNTSLTATMAKNLNEMERTYTEQARKQMPRFAGLPLAPGRTTSQPSGAAFQYAANVAPPNPSAPGAPPVSIVSTNAMTTAPFTVVGFAKKP
jgi:hypothetical protein